MANPNKLVYFSPIFIIILLSLAPKIIHAIDNNATTQSHKGFSLRLVHGNGPNLAQMDATRRREFIKMSKLRIKSLANLGKNNKTKNDDPTIRPPIRLGSFIYAVELGMGTFDPIPSHKTVHLGFDTASDLIWTQCEGCGNNCFRQVDPLYPASKSITYKEVPCHTECPSGAKCENNICKLETDYGDGAKVDSVLAHESFTFETPTTPRLVDFILFGCGLNMQGFHQDDDPNNKISGIFGMSYGARSFHEQKKTVVNGKFQYCLQKKEYQDLPPMLLRFGDDCIQPGKPSATPMFQHQNKPYYYLDLRGIQVNKKDLEIPPNAFQITPDGKGGTIIDTGTSISLVTTSAYQALEKEVAASIESRNSNLERLDDASARYEGFGLCYRRVREPTTLNLPWITWKFANNVIFVMNSDVTFEIYTKHDGQVLVCLKIFENSMEDGDGMTVLGSTQQVGHRITYDIPNGQLLVANEDCNKGR